nr:lactonase family protein [Halalkalibacter urbisdiaboli]
MSEKTFIGYVGTYTKKESKGIYRFRLDTEAKQIRDVQVAATFDNPTYVTISHDGNYLYAVGKEGDQGGVASYAIDNNKELTKINHQLMDGASPCHVSTDRENHQLVTANYHKGTIDSYLLKEDGAIAPVTSIMQHEGSGPNKERQEKPHAHYAGFTPDEKYVIGVDLGCDQIFTYAIDNGALEKVQTLSVKPGSGPRHLAFHPNGKTAYVMTELSSEVIVLAYNEEDGRFTEKQYISTIPTDFTENNQGSAIHISSDGQFVYAGNRGHDSLAIFSVEKDSDELTFIENTSTEGQWPRDFVLDPTEAFLIASNQETGNLVLFSRDQLSGKLTLLQSDIQVPEAVCVKFL